MKKVISVYKPVGPTPLDIIKKLRQTFPVYEKVKLGYAGRLDPMAEGLLLILAGGENKKRKDFELLPKTYKFEIIFGISTDSYDLLGKILKIKQKKPSKNFKTELNKAMSGLVGISSQPYPPYSSARVNGKPLFYWARENKLEKIKIPQKDIEIYESNLLDIYYLNSKDLKKNVEEKIGKVYGEFRQKEILEKWSKFFEKYPNKTFTVATCRINCSSGTYIRSIANEIGKKLNLPSCTFSIKRTAVGKYKLKDSLLAK